MPVEISTLALGPSALGRRFAPSEGTNLTVDIHIAVSVCYYKFYVFVFLSYFSDRQSNDATLLYVQALCQEME